MKYIVLEYLYGELEDGLNKAAIKGLKLHSVHFWPKSDQWITVIYIKEDAA